jgi:hypothetical protein
VDDPVSRVDPNGLWWDPWDESRVPRKENGQFDSTGGGGKNGGGSKRIKEPYSKKTPLEAPNTDRKYYRIAERPLEGGEKLYSPGALFRHVQLIADDGANIGRFADSIRAEEERLWGQYTYSEPQIKFDAELIEAALREYITSKRRSEDIFNDLNQEDQWIQPDSYQLAGQNCQNFVKDIIRIATRLSQERNIPLVKK